MGQPLRQMGLAKGASGFWSQFLRLDDEEIACDIQNM